MNKIRYFFNLLLVVLMLLTVAVNRNQRIFSKQINETASSEQSEPRTESLNDDGQRVVDSKTLSKAIGYGGYTPVNLVVEGDKVVAIELQENFETLSFLGKVKRSGLLEAWNGLTLDQAMAKDVDVVSGATMSSTAIIANVKAAISYAGSVEQVAEQNNIFTLKNIAGLFVIAFGVVMTFLKVKSKKWRLVQLVLNVAVLGFWCGSFLSMSLLTNWLANGVNFSTALLSFVLLVVAVVIPFVGKKSNYCAHHCPMGSAQELMSKVKVEKIKLGATTVKYLGYAREILLLGMLAVMWLGFGFEIMDYEAFSAFMFSQASSVVLIMALFFLMLSAFVTRPYCRFVCPTGSLMKITQMK